MAEKDYAPEYDSNASLERCKKQLFSQSDTSHISKRR
jgi:hypothetical protein